MEMKKLIGNVLLTAGLVAGAITAARIPPMWGGLAVSLAVMGAGIFLRRQGAKEELHRAAQSGTGGVRELERLLSDAIVRIEKIMDAPAEKVTAELTKILEELDEFAEKAQPLRIEGLMTYGTIMSVFSRGERALNRAWSAFADGYESEGRRYLHYGYEDLKETLSAVKALKV
ncbi:BREX-1 system adenine-specific DNA-methyltransferase PglX [Thermococcus sp. 5-4]|uniref:BREX-1 system adenine-specific DNA-methyltransferase PglX n=1 Tax=Thermococcus sp. 5-4 TaxID=2008440 RepID=UPI001D04B2F4|nr:BREX-1 system adenine-specific DNA-methyltransferase PglX [Thermococcus sp. 5-4]